MGYSRGFIDKAKLSAKKGRDNEIKIKNGLIPPKPPRIRQPFHLVLPFHTQTKHLKYSCIEKGIEVVFTSKDSLGGRVTRKNRTPIDSGVYILPCKAPTCNKVYVGQSQDLQTRSDDHRAGIRGRTCLAKMASVRHKHPGTSFRLDPDRAIVPYRSTNKPHRLIVETSLITLCDTVSNTKVSSCNKDMNTIGPIILAASNIDWKLLATVQPKFNLQLIPKSQRRYFSTQSQMNNDLLIPLQDDPTHVPRPPELEPSGYNLRSNINPNIPSS